MHSAFQSYCRSVIFDKKRQITSFISNSEQYITLYTVHLVFFLIPNFRETKNNYCGSKVMGREFFLSSQIVQTVTSAVTFSSTVFFSLVAVSAIVLLAALPKLKRISERHTI